MAHVGHRFLSMTSPLGLTRSSPIAFSLEETLSQPFVGIIDVVSEHATIDPEKLLHQPVCVSLRQSEALKRKVRGLVRRSPPRCPAGGTRSATDLRSFRPVVPVADRGLPHLREQDDEGDRADDLQGA